MTETINGNRMGNGFYVGQSFPIVSVNDIVVGQSLFNTAGTHNIFALSTFFDSTDGNQIGVMQDETTLTPGTRRWITKIDNTAGELSVFAHDGTTLLYSFGGQGSSIMLELGPDNSTWWIM